VRCFPFPDRRLATLYALIETAKANGLEPYRYRRHLFEHLPAATTDAQRKALLPQHIDPKNLTIPA
jgi:transposase